MTANYVPAPPGSEALGPENARGTATAVARFASRYEVLAELGRGSAGVVYLAHDTSLGRDVALKVVLGGPHASPVEVARFRTEAEAIARLNHPGIVQIYEVGEHDGHPFIALELCRAGSLAERLQAGPLPPREAAGLVAGLAEAVHAAHQANVLHRDLKPANVLLTPEGLPKIGDFGLAKKLDECDRTQPGSILGSPWYMAPEQARGEKVGPAADTYALGAILYECLTGRPPFLAAAAYDVIAQVLDQEPVRPTRLTPRLPRDLETICLKCLHKSAGERYASAGELAEDLRRWQRGEAIRARPDGVTRRTSRWVRRNATVAILAALVFLTMTAGIVVASLLAMRANEKRIEAELNKEKAIEALIDGILRPIGRNGVGPLPDAGERDALTALAQLHDDGWQLRLLETALNRPGDAERLARRADWMAAAGVGLVPERREAVAARLRERSPTVSPWEKWAVARFSLELNLPEEGLVRDAARLLTVDLHNATRRDEINRLANGLAALADGMDAATAWDAASALKSPLLLNDGDFAPLAGSLAVLAARLGPDEADNVAGWLLNCLDQPLQEKDLIRLASDQAAVCRHVRPALAAKHLNQMAARLAKRLGSPDCEDAIAVATALLSLCDQLAPEDAAAQANVVASSILPFLYGARDQAELARFSPVFRTAARWLDEATVEKLSTSALDTLREALTAIVRQDTSAVAAVLAALGPRLDPRQAADAAGLLAAALGRGATTTEEIAYLGEALASVCGRLDAAEAARLAGGAVRRIAVLRADLPPRETEHRAIALTALARWLEPADAAKVADLLTVATSGPKLDVRQLFPLAVAQAAVSTRLGPDAARKHGAHAARALVAGLDGANDPDRVVRLGTALAALADRLDTTTAGTLADALAAHLAKDSDNRSLVAEALGVLAAWAGPEAAARAAKCLLTDGWAAVRNEADLAAVTAGLEAAAARLPTRDLVRLLAHPDATPVSNRVVLDALGRPLRKHFRNAWHFVDWARSNGIDALALLKTDQKP